jgi:hypothetical protein
LGRHSDWLVWNYAMEAYMKVEEFGFGFNIFGETKGWNIVETFLKGRTCGKLVPCLFSHCLQVRFCGK